MIKNDVMLLLLLFFFFSKKIKLKIKSRSSHREQVVRYVTYFCPPLNKVNLINKFIFFIAKVICLIQKFTYNFEI